MSDAQAISKKELEHANSLQWRNNRCFFCKGTANGAGMQVQLHDPKTEDYNFALKRWQTTSIVVPRCRNCENVNETLKGYQKGFLFSALFFMAIGTGVGIVTYDLHKLDILPITFAGVGFLLSVAILIFRVKKLLKIKGSAGSPSMQHFEYPPIKYLLDNGWKVGLEA